MQMLWTLITANYLKELEMKAHTKWARNTHTHTSDYIIFVSIFFGFVAAPVFLCSHTYLLDFTFHHILGEQTMRRCGLTDWLNSPKQANYKYTHILPRQVCVTRTENKP